MHIDITPDTERLVREEISSGHFHSVDDLIISSVHAWREMHAAIAGATGTRVSPQVAPKAGGEPVLRPIWEIVLDNMKDIPLEEFEKLPEDGASQVDHYLYGHPRR